MRHRALVLPIFALVIALLAGPGLLRAQEATPAAELPAILQAYEDAWSSGDAAQVGALYSEDAIREDVPTGTASDGRAAIEAFAAGLFTMDRDVRLDVTGGFTGETWAVAEWTYRGVHQATGGEVTFRGASVLELADGLISRESDYYDLPEMQQQIATAEGTPSASETPAGSADAEHVGSVTVRVFTCPAEMSQTTGEEAPDLAALLASCTPLDAPETTPTLSMLPDGEAASGTMTEPGVYHWDGLILGDYAVGGSGKMPADFGGLRVTDASGAPLQNPVLRLEGTSPHVEYYYFYFRVA